MAVYTISPDFLEKIEDDERRYLSDILFVFSNGTNTYKVAQDRDGKILDAYKSIRNNADTIKKWIDFMSLSPSKFEKIDVDITSIDSDEEKAIKLCKETKGLSKIIVYSIQNITVCECNDNKIQYEGKLLTVLDRDEAKEELNKKEGNTNINIAHSQVAGGNIENSTNK